MISKLLLYLAEICLKAAVIICPKNDIGYRLLSKIDEYISEELG